MDYGLFKIVGAVAGIGGIALASAVYIFREVIRKEIFPQLTKEQAYNLLNRIIVLIFIIGVLGIIAYVVLNFRNDIPPVARVFTGRVFNKTNADENIRNAQVSIEGEGTRTLVMTDSEGIFSFTLSDPNKEILLHVKAEGFEPFELRIIPARIPGTQPIPLAPQAETISQLWGYVLDSNEKPLPGATVWLQDFPEISRVETATDGRFWIKDIPTKYGDMVRVLAVKEGYQPNPCVRDMQLGQGSRVIHLTLHPRASRLPC